MSWETADRREPDYASALRADTRARLADQLVGLTEIAERLAVSRRVVTTWSHDSHFPFPVAELRMGRVWLFEDVWRWAVRTGHLR